MKQDIHPKYAAVEATCTCGSTFTINSTLSQPSLDLDVCSNCHPFYTGKQKQAASGGRVERFSQRFGKRSTK